MNNCTETQAESRAVWDGLARRSPSPKSVSDTSSQPGCQDAPALSGSSFCRQYLGHIEKTPQCNPSPPTHTHTVLVSPGTPPCMHQVPRRGAEVTGTDVVQDISRGDIWKQAREGVGRWP